MLLSYWVGRVKGAHCTMIPDSLFHASRPIYFEHDDEEEYPYFGLGTFFLCAWRGRHFAVTASHVLKGRSGSSVRFLAHDTSNWFLPTDLYSAPEGEGVGCGDIVIWRIAEDAPSGNWRNDCLPLDAASIRPGPAMYVTGARLAITGYPCQERNIDYSDKRLRHCRVILPARYLGQSDFGYDHVHKMRLTARAIITDLNGFSGSPVLAEAPAHGWGFAGVAIMGHASEGNVHFIDGALVYHALAQLT